MRSLLVVLCLCLCPSSAVAQSSSGKAFELASIYVHPTNQDGKIGFYGSAGGSVELGMCTISMLVAYAFDVDDSLIVGTPDWVPKIYYDIKALPPDSSPSRKLNLAGYTTMPTSEQREMILNLLVDRFGFRYHIEAREMPVYLLERGKGPLKLEPPKYPERAADPRGGLMVRGDLATGEGFGQSLTMEFLAKQLAWPLERPVIDRTGIQGVYDFNVEPIDSENQDKVRAAFLMTKWLGLNLTSGRAPVRTVHIDAVTPPTPN